MVLTSQIISYLSSNKERYKRDFHLTKIGLFGSYARGEQTDKSDIDLIVEFEEETENLYLLKQTLKREIQSQFQLPVDICREKYIKPVFKKQILSEVRYA